MARKNMFMAALTRQRYRMRYNTACDTGRLEDSHAAETVTIVAQVHGRPYSTYSDERVRRRFLTSWCDACLQKEAVVAFLA